MNDVAPRNIDHPLRVHFVVHHHLKRGSGVAGATLSLADALTGLGHAVSFYGFEDAFGKDAGREVPRMLRFPWKVAEHLRHHARDVDVVDASTGDAWAWSLFGRPGAGHSALVTRSHGLEHVATNELRKRALRGELHLSRKYPLYHGGWRLLEVTRSLRAADAQIFLNQIDFDYATRDLGVEPGSAAIVPHGIAARMLGTSPSGEWDDRGPIELAFIGTWVPLKGKRDLVEMARVLTSRNVSFRLRILGSAVSAEAVLADFDEVSRQVVTVVPEFAPESLPALLAGAAIFLHLSWTEGFGLALVESMAAGLAPVATRSGVATTVIQDGRSGLLLGEATAIAAADAIGRLVRDPQLVSRLRRGARDAVQRLRWEEIAARTVDVYRAAIARRRTALGRAS